MQFIVIFIWNGLITKILLQSKPLYSNFNAVFDVYLDYYQCIIMLFKFFLKIVFDECYDKMRRLILEAMTLNIPSWMF